MIPSFDVDQKIKSASVSRRKTGPVLVKEGP
jgi:hypothetical protein